jgi:hypothetical protein
MKLGLMLTTSISIRKNDVVKASIILSLVVVAAFSPVIFLEQTYYRNLPLQPELLGYEQKSTLFGNTLDYTGSAFWPNIKLATELMWDGIIPLWNPHVGVGQPLAADSTHHIFSPFNFGFFLPVEFWDIPIFVGLWFTGIFTFLFLRCFGLNFTSCISGAIFYMLSGGFTWFLTNPNIVVMIFTPMVLFSAEKIIQNKNIKYVVLASTAIALSVLAAHLESIILQFMLVGAYVSFRILQQVKLNFYKKQHKNILDHNISKRIKIKPIILWVTVAFIGGLGLSAFFILPVYEYIENNEFEHDDKYGVGHVAPFNVLSTFSPYVLGPIHAYWIPLDSGEIGLWGYVGIFSLFLSIIGVYFSLKSNHSYKWIPVFFLAISIFFIMKIIGVPIVNWIGYLPILNMLSFTGYLGVIIPFGFAVSASFGIDYLSKNKIKIKSIGIISIICVSIILLLLVPILPYFLSSDTIFPPHITENDAKNYVGFHIIQAIGFVFVAFLLSVAISRNRKISFIIIPIILLELSIYIPMGLHPIEMAYKFIIVMAGMIVMLIIILKSNVFISKINSNKIMIYLIVGIVASTFLGLVLVSDFSSFGMIKKYNSFGIDPVTDFLKENLGEHRMFSLGNTLEPNYSAAYGINSLGVLLPFNIDSFYYFIHNFLDDEANAGRLGSPPWTYYHGPEKAIDKIFENKKYFDFLGVKYFVMEGYDFNTIVSGVPGQSGQFTKIMSNHNIVQSFVSPTNSIFGIGVSLGTYQAQDQGEIILTLDSIPKENKYHRESVLNFTINQKLNEFKIIPPLLDIEDKEFYFSLKYPEADNGKIAVVFTQEIENNLQGKYYENDVKVDGKQIVFSINSNSVEHPVVFKFHDINIHENTEVFPRVFLVNEFHTVEPDMAQKYLLDNPDFDLRHKVVLEQELSEDRKKLLGSPSNYGSTAEIISYAANNIIIHTENKDASLLILTDAYYPGWVSFVDGSKSDIYRADGLVRAVFIPAGEHTVEFSYMPQSFTNGLIISLVTLVILVGIFLYSRKTWIKKLEVVSTN